MDEAAALPITAGFVVPSAQAVLRPPPTPTRHDLHFPAHHRLWEATLRPPPSRERSGRGGSPRFPLPPSQRSEPHTPGGSSGLRFQALHPFHGLRRDNRGSAPPVPARRRRPNDAAGFASRYGPLSCSPQGAFDAGLRPGPFPDRAASLLPGLLAATRTGLAPAGDNELMSDQVISTNHPRLPGAHRLGREGSVRAGAGVAPAFDSKQEGADGNRRPQAGSTTTPTEPSR